MREYVVDETLEKKIQSTLTEYLQSLNQNNVAENVRNLTDINGGIC